MNRPKPFVAASALFKFLVHDVPAFQLYTSPAITDLWNSAIRKLDHDQPDQLNMQQVLASRLLIRALVEDLAGNRDAVLAQLCMNRLPLYSPDHIQQALEQCLDDLGVLLQARADESVRAQVLVQH